MSGSFSWVDWTVVGALLLLTTWVGHRAADLNLALSASRPGAGQCPHHDNTYGIIMMTEMKRS